MGSPEDPCGLDIMQCESYRNYCVVQCILLGAVSVFKELRVMTSRKVLLKFRAQA